MGRIVDEKGCPVDSFADESEIAEQRHLDTLRNPEEQEVLDQYQDYGVYKLTWEIGVSVPTYIALLCDYSNGNMNWQVFDEETAKKKCEELAKQYKRTCPEDALVSFAVLPIPKENHWQ